MSKTFDPAGTFMWIGIALLAFHFGGAAASGVVFISASLLADYLHEEEEQLS